MIVNSRLIVLTNGYVSMANECLMIAKNGQQWAIVMINGYSWLLSDEWPGWLMDGE